MTKILNVVIMKNSMQKNKDIFNQVINQCLIFGIFISALGFLTDFDNTIKFAGNDLRTRVVGARLLINQFDPYFFKWNEDISDVYLDPGDSPYSPVSRVTVTPTVLIIHSIAAKLPYKLQRVLWFIIQWVLFLMTLLLFSKSTISNSKSKLIWIIGLFFISGSFFWRLHVERGQIYILYVFLITLSYWLLQKEFKHSVIFSGILIGLTVSLYPLVILMFIPMIVYKKWKLLLANIIGLQSGLSISIILTDIGLWRKYISSLYIHSKMYLGIIDYYGFYSKFDAEGMKNFFIWNFLPSFDASLQKVIKKLTGINLSLNFILTFSALFLVFIILFLYFSRHKNISMNKLFLIGITIVYVIEFLLPMERLSYNDVIWIIPLSLIISNCDLRKLLLRPSTVLLVIGLIFSTSFHLLPYSGLICHYSILFYTALTTLLVIRSRFYL